MIETPTAPLGFVPLKILCVIRRDGLRRNVTWKRYRNSPGGCWDAEGNYFAIPEKGRSRKMVKQKKKNVMPIKKNSQTHILFYFCDGFSMEFVLESLS